MNEKLCKHCNLPISRSKRTDAIFCSIKCGSDYRNKRNATHEKEKRQIDSRLVKNYKIIKDLFNRVKLDVSREALELLGFDFDLYTSVVNTDPITKTSVIRIYEYQISIQGSRCKIEKLLL